MADSIVTLSVGVGVGDQDESTSSICSAKLSNRIRLPTTNRPGMLYVAYVYVYIPAVGASFVQWALFHGFIGMMSWAYYMGLVTDPGVIPDVGWHDVVGEIFGWGFGGKSKFILKTVPHSGKSGSVFVAGERLVVRG